MILPLTITFILNRFVSPGIHESIPIAHVPKVQLVGINLDQISLQPAEFVKLTIIIYLASYFQRNQGRMGSQT